MSGFTTRAVHAPFLKKDPHGALHMPVYESVSFEFETAEEIEEAFLGKRPRHTYTRTTNPTVEHLEQKVRHITGALGVIAVSSGMAAIANTILSIARQGENIVTTKVVFGNTYSLFERTLKPWGLETRYADFARPETIEPLIDTNTRALFFETITNPQLEVADIQALAAIARRHRDPADRRYNGDTPVFLQQQRPGRRYRGTLQHEIRLRRRHDSRGHHHRQWDLQLGADPEAGERSEAVRTLYPPDEIETRSVPQSGACLSPHNAYLQSLGLETLALRADRSCRNTKVLAEFLSGQAKVKRVNYPGLESSPYHEVATRLFGERCGALVTFELSSKKECFTFLNKLKLLRRATNIHDNKTLALHPASTIFCEYPADLKRQMGVPETLIRLSVGIEDVEDLIADIVQALED